MRSSLRSLRSVALLLAALITVFAAPRLHAQDVPAREGDGARAVAAERTAVLVGWPDEAAGADWYDRLRRADLIAFVDTLAVRYTARVEEDVPSVRAALRWAPGDGGILDGQRVSYELLPEDVRLVALALDADVVVDGERIGGLAVEIDSFALAPAPDVYAFETGPLDWSTLFTGASADAAREAFARGFTLENLRIRSIAFGADYEDEPRGPYTVVNDPRPPRRVGVYTREPVIIIDTRLGWLLGRPARPARPNGEPRGESVGRGGSLGDGGETRTRGGRGVDEATRPGDRAEDGVRGGRVDGDGASGTRTGTRSGRDVSGEGGDDGVGRSEGRTGGLFGGRGSRGDDGDTGKKSDDEDEDDEDDDTNELLPAGLVAAAAVGVLAYHTGTVGYLGQTRYAPFGVTAGWVRSGGGILAHAGVSEAVLSSGEGPRHISGGFYGFWDAFGLPLQPVVGLGVLATDGGASVAAEPSISAGVALNAGPVLGLAAWDLVHGGLGVGVAFNFRSGWWHGR